MPLVVPHHPPSRDDAEEAPLALPVIDLAAWRDRHASPEAAAAATAQCALLADALHRYGLLLVRDSRATEADNSAFIDLLEAYMAQPDTTKAPDIHPELSYQVGLTPERIEKPVNHCAKVALMRDPPLSLCPPERDAKARFFWRLGGPPPANTAFPSLNAAAVVPAAFPAWSATMDGWGGKLLAAVHDVAEMAAVGFNLPVDTFSAMMSGAPHLLAPTASDLSRFGALGTVLAGFHTDLNAITIHGRSRYR